MTLPVNEAAQRSRAAIREATAGLVDRELLAELRYWLRSRRNMLVIGPPGTAKSAVVRRVAHSLGGQYFEYLLGRFTSHPSCSGPVNLSKLREGQVETDIAACCRRRKSPSRRSFLGSTAVLNTLLGC